MMEIENQQYLFQARIIMKAKVKQVGTCDSKQDICLVPKYFLPVLSITKGKAVT